ncbi:MAG: excinuclease ABC subunit B [Deltaproteobacteria bacterium CG11_big_fil_rev_8_21_14_0_20_49_13]|nr:MAG: excinuclease ABC subunit B [Deltaproteobacteria bacterium CG11_big_fil_rev_8_21_14_0_20_49_13]
MKSKLFKPDPRGKGGELFGLTTTFEPKGDQPQAIDMLTKGVLRGEKHQTLLGVTGSGKTFSIAHVIANTGKPALIMAPNKTLAAQLYQEFKQLFPQNAVEYFVSYYDYYQPEAYLPAQDLFIEKDSSVNDAIDRLRHSATHSLLTRNDVIIVASVSCIYGLGSPDAYSAMHIDIKKGEHIERNDLLSKLVEIRYERNDVDFHRGTFRVRGETVEIFPAYEDLKAVRVEFFGDEVEKITEIDYLTGETEGEIDKIAIYPNSHYVTPEERLKVAIKGIRIELNERLKELEHSNKILEAQRIKQRTNYDLEMMEEIGFCKGIENYSRWLDGRKKGQPPRTLLDYFPKDFLLFIDESHITVPQTGGMFSGDRSRKTTLVEYGFRLPSALDNRPLNFEEFEKRVGQVIYTSATPSEYEMKLSGKNIAEQVVRPTGLIDPKPIVRPSKGQIKDLEKEIKARVDKGERVLVTTLTKRMAEDLSSYFQENDIKAKYMHSDTETLERIAIIRDLRLGKFDVLVGINLLREGLDLPEVSLVAILDADKEGFLRSARSLIQTFGRAARNINGEVILYADKMTNSMKRAISETNRRRKIQEKYNKKHGITPETVKKEITDILNSIYESDYVSLATEEEAIDPNKLPKKIAKLRKEMFAAAKKLDFEKAAEARDKIKALEEMALK